jgi:hypothetical protein
MTSPAKTGAAAPSGDVNFLMEVKQDLTSREQADVEDMENKASHLPHTNPHHHPSSL